MAVKQLLPAILSACVVGCGVSGESPILEPAPAVIDLAAGKVDPRLVGTWRNPGETYTFVSDGHFKLRIDRMEQTGQTTSARRVANLAGHWSATSDALLISVERGEDGAAHKLMMKLKDGGKTLELRPTFVSKAPPTVYKKS